MEGKMETREYKKGEVIAEAIIKEYWNYPEYKVLCAAEDDSGEFVVYTTDNSTDERWFKNIKEAREFYHSIPYEGYIEPE